jgi:hypothetical protein
MATGLQLSHARIFQEAIKNGLQSFVLPSSLVATSAIGTPASGYFYSPILGRSSIDDLSRDLKVSMGVERIRFLSADAVLNEIGPAKERIWALPNEDRIRFIGEWAFANDSGKEYRAKIVSASVSAPAYMEIVFYGTGLSLLATIDAASRSGITCSVDQGSYSSELFPTGTPSGSTNTRNFAPNQILKIANNLTLGLHVATIRFTSVQEVYGIDILNEQTSNIVVNPGTAFIDGLKVAYPGGNMPYDKDVVGSRGGRQLVYLKADGTIGNVFRAVDAVAKYMANTDHSNEEAARTYFPREFSNNATYDFGRVFASNAAVTHTLSDGTTTLSTNGGQISVPAGATTDGLVISSASNWIEFTFVGTGLDIVHLRSSGVQVMDAHVVTLNGVAIGNLPDVAVPVNTTIASGLPYGTHVVKITRSTATAAGCWINSFKVYQPKKPTLPDSTMELADYNVLANFDANATAGDAYLATGVIRKVALMEASYFGSWTVALPQGSSVSGYTLDSASGAGSIGSSSTFHFWGTGVEVRMYQPVLSASTFAINGSSSFASMANGSGGTGITTSFYGGSGSTITVSTTNGSANVTTTSTANLSAGISITGSGIPANSTVVSVTNATTFVISAAATATATNVAATVSARFNSTTGVLAGDTTSRGSGVRFSNLPLGLHTITVTKNTNTLLSLESFDVITPIYFPVQKESHITGTPLPVGGNSLLDLRKFELTAKKQDDTYHNAAGKVLNVWYASAGTATQTISSTVPVAINGLSITVKPASVNSRFLIMAVVNGSLSHVCSSFVFRNGYAVLSHGGNTSIGGANVTSYVTAENRADLMRAHTINYLDAPATTAAVTYDIRHASAWSGAATTTYVNNRSTVDMACPSVLTIIEFEN